MNINIDFPKKLATAYNAICKPLCRELNIPQTAFDILMFLANNPDYSTAGDIVNIRKIKANLVSVNVERLANVERGRQLQQTFFDVLFENTTDEMKKNFTETVKIIDRNLDGILKG